LATNPRLVKELYLATGKGFDATVIFFSLGNWSVKLDEEIRTFFPATRFIELSATRKPFFLWLISTMLEKICRLVPYNLLSGYMISIAVSKRSYLLKRSARKLKEQFDWIIAHNPAAFYPAFYHAKKMATNLGIDVEDYHPGETIDSKVSERMRSYMKLVLPNARYCSYASPLIMKEVLHDIPALHKNQFVLLNSFAEKEFALPALNNYEKIRLVWYSQNINEGRGIEKFCSILAKYNTSFELHLYGNMNQQFFDKYLKSLQNLVYHGVVNQKVLHSQLGTYDIGLAIEDGKANLNRQLCITNKILSYMQAGLFVIATDTPAQRALLLDKKRSGIITTLDEPDIEKAFNFINNNITEIRSNKAAIYNEAKSLAWEEESKKMDFIFK
jgi:glycosyltransferase involved in cell wall biosynthesis